MIRLFAAAAALAAALIVPTVAVAGQNHGGNGNGQPKVTICHKAEGKNPVTITVAIAALPAHLFLHGDTLGKCKTTKPPCVYKTDKKQYTSSAYRKCDEGPNEPPTNPPPTDPPGDGEGEVVQVNRTGYCFQTSNYGWTFVNLTADETIDAGNAWFDLYVAKATVELDGKQVTFAGWEDWRTDGGILVAPFVDGIGQTCDNPYVK